MKATTRFHLGAALLFTFAPLLHSRTSADYLIAAETLDFGGQHATSADYASDASIAVIVDTSAEPITPAIARSGYIGQLYELIGYGLLASTYYPPELGTTQLFTVRTADDGTNVVIPTTGFTFSVLSGPLTSVSATGLVTAGAIYQNTAAIVGATSAAFAGQLMLPLNVQDTIPDNYGTYAGDGLPDSWQFQYFGLDNPLAAPLLDPDGDGQDNRFEYTAGIVPTDPLSRFFFRIEKDPGVSDYKKLIFSPTLPDRTYTVESNTTLTGGIWAPLIDVEDDSQQPVRTVIDRAASETKKFYHVEITKP
ncbi:MAG: hypothetical protein ABI600_02560 [Luteolibacter sp.]